MRSTEQASKPSVGIVTYFNFEKTANHPLDNLIALVNPLTHKTFLITGGDYSNPRHEIEIIRTRSTRRHLFIAKVLEQVLAQLQVLHILLQLRNEIKLLLFFNGEGFTLPLIFARGLGIKCVIIVTYLGAAPVIQAIREIGDKKHSQEILRLRILEMLERLSYCFADKLIVYSPSIIDAAHMRRYTDKIIVAHRHFVNFEQYRFKNDIEQRDNAVGYVGRLREEKGVINFVEAIPKIASTRNDVTFFIIGEGPLEGKIRNYLRKCDLDSKVTLTGRIQHNELPNYLACLKLLVLPSFNEGLPNIMLEAMACGTPVLITPIGSVPDVLTDGQTGFLIQDTSPPRLAQTILNTLASPHLKIVARNARTLVEEEFRYEKTLWTWERIISTLAANGSE